MMVHVWVRTASAALATSALLCFSGCGGGAAPSAPTPLVARVVDARVTTSVDSASTMRADLEITIEFLRDGCVGARVMRRNEGNVFYFDVTFFAQVVVCDQMGHAGDTFPLQIVVATGLQSGTYTVDVNGTRVAFNVP